MSRLVLGGIAILAGLLLVGWWGWPLAWSEAPGEVIVYTALDQEFSDPVFGHFQRQTGRLVRAKFDTEATKSVGLANALLAEAHRPRADVFWNNEIVSTIRLDRAGLLEPYECPAGADIAPAFRSPRHTWYGMAARARVLLVNRQRIGAGPTPSSVRDLADPRWRGQAGLAKPLFGTTATHAACWFALWGVDEARQFLRALRENQVQVLPGNLQVAQAVGRGELVFGLTDTDDALGQLELGLPVEIVYPDQASDLPGTLFIPNTVAIIRGGPHPQVARQLVDFLLGGEVESLLAQGPSGQIPLSRRVDVPLRVETPRTVRAMEIDFERAADAWDTAARAVRDELLTP